MRLEFKATVVGNVPTFITQGELNMVRGAEDQAGPLDDGHHGAQ